MPGGAILAGVDGARLGFRCVPGEFGSGAGDPDRKVGLAHRSAPLPAQAAHCVRHFFERHAHRTDRGRGR